MQLNATSSRKVLAGIALTLAVAWIVVGGRRAESTVRPSVVDAPRALAGKSTFGTVPADDKIDPVSSYRQTPDLVRVENPTSGELIGYARKSDLFPSVAAELGERSADMEDPYAPASPSEAASMGTSDYYLPLYDGSAKLIGYLQGGSESVIKPGELPPPSAKSRNGTVTLPTGP